MRKEGILRTRCVAGSKDIFEILLLHPKFTVRIRPSPVPKSVLPNHFIFSGILILILYFDLNATVFKENKFLAILMISLYLNIIFREVWQRLECLKVCRLEHLFYS